eukprot:scaffold25732_cov70-Phaeocystis_antarctica.AAC.5
MTSNEETMTMPARDTGPLKPSRPPLSTTPQSGSPPTPVSKSKSWVNSNCARGTHSHAEIRTGTPLSQLSILSTVIMNTRLKLQLDGVAVLVLVAEPRATPRGVAPRRARVAVLASVDRAGRVPADGGDGVAMHRHDPLVLPPCRAVGVEARNVLRCVPRVGRGAHRSERSLGGGRLCPAAPRVRLGHAKPAPQPPHCACGVGRELLERGERHEVCGRRAAAAAGLQPGLDGEPVRDKLLQAEVVHESTHRVRLHERVARDEDEPDGADVGAGQTPERVQPARRQRVRRRLFEQHGPAQIPMSGPLSEEPPPALA